MIDGLENWREIDHRERALLMHLLRGDFQGKAEILEQMSSVEVMRISPTGSLKLRSQGPLAIVKDNDALRLDQTTIYPSRAFTTMKLQTRKVSFASPDLCDWRCT